MQGVFFCIFISSFSADLPNLTESLKLPKMLYLLYSHLSSSRIIWTQHTKLWKTTCLSSAAHKVFAARRFLWHICGCTVPQWDILYQHKSTSYWKNSFSLRKLALDSANTKCFYQCINYVHTSRERIPFFENSHITIPLRMAIDLIKTLAISFVQRC